MLGSGFESLQETEDANCRVAPFQAKDQRVDGDFGLRTTTDNCLTIGLDRELDLGSGIRERE